jgi:O-antigen/teichoic acid export membrane protein
MMILILAAPWISDEPQLVRGLQVSAPLILIGPFVSSFTAVFRARQVMWPVAFLNTGMLLVQLILTLLVLAAGGGVMAALTVNLMTSVGQLVAAWGIYRTRFYRRFDKTSIGAPLASVLALMRRAWPFALAAILSALQLRLSVILLEQFRGAAETGQFAAAGRFVEAGRMLPNALFGALFPAISAGRDTDKDLQRVFRRARWTLAVYGLLFGLGAVLFSTWLVRLTYGPDFAPAIPVLQALGWSLLPGILKGAQIIYCYARGQEARVNRVLGLTLIAQLVLGLWLIPQYGALGAALAVILTESLALLSLWR